ncbi:MAG: hypothetical protein O3C57_05395 [Verrucomicrobia bacterium]|nr:hypothetical protein [Verrucomicrobiota bacterium]
MTRLGLQSGAFALIACLVTPCARGDNTSANVPSGGWVVDDFSFSMGYRPVRHADPFMRAWIDIAGQHVILPASKDLLENFTGSSAKGRCAKCHSIDQTDTGAFKMNWQASKPNSEKRFTVFDHGPHILMIETDVDLWSKTEKVQVSAADCRACHQLKARGDSAYMRAFLDVHNASLREPYVFSSNFMPMKKSLCVQCHNTQHGAGENCTQCHRFHIHSDVP